MGYVGGVADVKAKSCVLIVTPVTRFREDPVRMLRRVRLAAKLASHRERPQPHSEAGAADPQPSASGVFDEMEKLLLSGHGRRSLKEPAPARPASRLLPLLA